MPDDHLQFDELLERYRVRANKITPGKLFKLSGVPKSTIVNWLNGTTKRPQTWHDVVKLAATLRLSKSEVTQLLESIDYPSIEELMINATDEECNLLSPWAEPVLIGLGQTLYSIEDRRREAEDWKQLHEDCQAISHQIVVTQGLLMLREDNVRAKEYKLLLANIILQSLELHWNGCHSRIRRFIKLERLPDRVVKQDFIGEDQENDWTGSIREVTQEIDRILGQCVTTREFLVHIEDIQRNLHRLALTSNEMLRFLDGRLRRALRELDSDIGDARTRFAQARIFVD